MSEEVRVVDPETGGEKGRKLARYDLIPATPLRLLAEHYGLGANKYDDRNWERGYAWSLSFAALNRHLWAWWGGETNDPEMGDNHLIAVAWHALTLLEFSTTHPEKDDRPGSAPAKMEERPVFLYGPSLTESRRFFYPDSKETDHAPL